MSSADAFLQRYGRPPPPGLPKYAQLRELLASAIAAGHWKPGERLPAETELAEATGYSLGTVQKSLRALVDDGLVVRAQGSGTYVSEGRGAIDAPLHLRFLGGDGEPHFLPLFPKVLGRKAITERGAWSAWLGQKDIMRVDRSLSVNHEFEVFNRFYFNAATFPDIARKPMASLDGANLKQLLVAAEAMPIRNVEQRISLVKFTRDVSRATSTRPGTFGMLLESSASAGRGHPLYFLESFIPPNGRRLDVSGD